MLISPDPFTLAQLLLLWSIVLVAIGLFIRDERQARRAAKLAEAARFYALAPQYRHVSTRD